MDGILCADSPRFLFVPLKKALSKFGLRFSGDQMLDLRHKLQKITYYKQDW